MKINYWLVFSICITIGSLLLAKYNGIFFTYFIVYFVLTILLIIKIKDINPYKFILNKK